MAEYIRQDHHLPHGSLEPHITNGDRIRAMTDEELAYGIAHGFERPMDMSSPWCNLYCNELDSVKCGDCILEWLKKEVEE